MLDYLVYLIFLISVALAASGIILSSKLRTRHRSDTFSFLLYFQVFIYTFGFYGIWGQVLIKSFLLPVISADVLSRFSDISILLGLPFLVFAWFMLIRFSLNLTGRKSKKWFAFWFLFLNFSVLAALGYLITRDNNMKSTVLIREYFVTFNLVYTFTAAYVIHFPWKGYSLIHDADRRIIAPVIFLIMIIQSIILLLYSSQVWVGLVFIFTFFSGYAFLPVYLNYGTLLTALSEEPVRGFSFKEFCRKYEVSQRESEIIIEICKGLSNKEISTRLFISLQTVKDHTHRIYIKTNVRSRVQLINLVKEAIDQGTRSNISD